MGDGSSRRGREEGEGGGSWRSTEGSISSQPDCPCFNSHPISLRFLTSFTSTSTFKKTTSFSEISSERPSKTGEISLHGPHLQAGNGLGLKRTLEKVEEAMSLHLDAVNRAVNPLRCHAKNPEAEIPPSSPSFPPFHTAFPFP
jgi:hypothetical protein